MKDGEPSLEVRLGGIYALEKISQDARDEYHWTIVEVLTAYVRQNAPRTAHEEENSDARRIQEPIQPRADIQAALAVLGRRISFGSEPAPIDLRNSDLRGAQLINANLQCAQLSGVDLRGADLSFAWLGGADLEDALLDDANMTRADLAATQCAFSFPGTWIDGKRVAGPVVIKLGGRWVSASGASSVTMHSMTSLRRARLDRANLDGADLGGAYLAGAKLTDTDLRRVQNVTREQVSAALNQGRDARLPEDWSA